MDTNKNDARFMIHDLLISFILHLASSIRI